MVMDVLHSISEMGSYLRTWRWNDIVQYSYVHHQWAHGGDLFSEPTQFPGTIMVPELSRVRNELRELVRRNNHRAEAHGIVMNDGNIENQTFGDHNVLNPPQHSIADDCVGVMRVYPRGYRNTTDVMRENITLLASQTDHWFLSYVDDDSLGVLLRPVGIDAFSNDELREFYASLSSTLHEKNVKPVQADRIAIAALADITGIGLYTGRLFLRLPRYRITHTEQVMLSQMISVE